MPAGSSPREIREDCDAYEILRDPRRRLRHRLFSADPGAPLASLFTDEVRPRRFVGHGPWLEVLKGK